jgi:hypothetical protein
MKALDRFDVTLTHCFTPQAHGVPDERPSLERTDRKTGRVL